MQLGKYQDHKLKQVCSVICVARHDVSGEEMVVVEYEMGLVRSHAVLPSSRFFEQVEVGSQKLPRFTFKRPESRRLRRLERKADLHSHVMA